jgi:hypothetical protein
MATVTITRDNGVARVIANINDAFDRRKTAALVICKRYAKLSRQLIRKTQGLEQGEGTFWTNRTSNAIKSIYDFIIDDKSKGIVGFGLAHHMTYGKYLEGFDKDGNRIKENGALEQTVRAQVPFFMDEIKKVFSD